MTWQSYQLYELELESLHDSTESTSISILMINSLENMCPQAIAQEQQSLLEWQRLSEWDSQS